MTEQKPYLQIQNLYKTFGTFTALKDISLAIYSGEFVCFLGPSGCGKTTLLRCIAGLEEQTSGTIIQDGRNISRLPASQRDFGIVFQSYALFPNLNAFQNVAYGLQNMKLTREQVLTRVRELLELVGLSDFAQSYPAQLSGGQQQRVALARALALSPGLLLLDEPLSALDARVRAGLRTELSLLQRRLGVTTVMVTHDQEEALTLADRIVVMDKGTIQQVGKPQDIYRHPANPFVAGFVGEMNFMTGIVTETGWVKCGQHHLRVPNLNGTTQGTAVRLAIRPEDIILNGDLNGDSSENTWSAIIEYHEFLGAFYRLRIKLDDIHLIVDVPMTQARSLNFSDGQAIRVQLPSDLVRVYPL